MNIPAKLITTTIEEFKAEGYECKRAAVDSDGIVVDGANTQVVQLEFTKTEDAE